MSSEWQSYRLGDLFDLVNGFAFKGGEFKSTGIPVIKIKNVKPNNLLLSDLAFVDKDVADKRPDKELRRGDILITMSGNRMDGSRDTWVGKVAYFDISGRYMLNQRVGVLRPKNVVEVDRKCCSYFLSSDKFQDFFIAVATSSGGQANLSPSQILGEKINLPPLAEQKQIASLLASLDDRIAILREANQTLEAIAQVVFKSWFVDFAPVRAKAEGRLPDGIDEASAELFPDAFDETELGQVPKGWNVESLDKTASYLNGLALQKFPPTGQGDLPVIKIAQLRKGDTLGADLAASSIKPEYIIKNGDVLFSWSGSLEVDIWCGGNGALNQHLFKVTSSRFEKWFYYFWTKHHLASFRQIAESKATTMGHIQRAHLSNAKVVVPTDAIIAIANQLFTPLVERIVENTLQANTLSNLRDTLLPRLISGQLRIADAEAELEQATA